MFFFQTLIIDRFQMLSFSESGLISGHRVSSAVDISIKGRVDHHRRTVTLNATYTLPKQNPVKATLRGQIQSLSSHCIGIHGSWVMGEIRSGRFLFIVDTEQNAVSGSVMSTRPLTFDSTYKGSNIKLQDGDTVAHRTTSYSGSIVFSDAPIACIDGLLDDLVHIRSLARVSTTICSL